MEVVVTVAIVAVGMVMEQDTEESRHLEIICRGLVGQVVQKMEMVAVVVQKMEMVAVVVMAVVTMATAMAAAMGTTMPTAREIVPAKAQARVLLLMALARAHSLVVSLGIRTDTRRRHLQDRLVGAQMTRVACMETETEKTMTQRLVGIAGS